MNDLHKVEMDIYEAVKVVCENNNIPFFAIGGTCLGAVRHQGFIPWDDDLDIAVPIELYDKFWEACRRELPEHLKTFSSQFKSHSVFYFGKVINTQTTFINDALKEYPDEYRGCSIDIMPIAGVPENFLKRNLYVMKLKTIAALNNFIRHDKKKKYKNPLKRIGFGIFDRLGILQQIPIDFFWKAYMNEMRKNPFYSSKFTGYTWDPGTCHRIIVSTDDFRKTVNLPFETTFMSCPAGYDKFLTTMFGDYMQFPPENERVSGHSGFLDLNRPFSFYQELAKNGGKMPWNNQ